MNDVRHVIVMENHMMDWSVEYDHQLIMGKLGKIQQTNILKKYFKTFKQGWKQDHELLFNI